MLAVGGGGLRAANSAPGGARGADDGDEGIGGVGEAKKRKRGYNNIIRCGG